MNFVSCFRKINLLLNPVFVLGSTLIQSCTNVVNCVVLPKMEAYGFVSSFNSPLLKAQNFTII